MDEQQANVPVVTAADTIAELHRYIEDPLSREKLYKRLCRYVRNAQIVPPAEVDDEAYELLQDVVLTAMKIADKYHGSGIASWLLSIAGNLLKQKKKKHATRRETVVQLRDLHRQDYPMLSDEEFFELFTAQIVAVNVREAELRQDLKEAITHLSESDQRILNYYIQYGFDHNEIACILGIKPGAARTRYSRAVNHLRDNLMASDAQKGGKSDA